MEMSFTYMFIVLQIKLISIYNGCASGLVLKQRQKAIHGLYIQKFSFEWTD